jgi:hypothetical protein
MLFVSRFVRLEEQMCEVAGPGSSLSSASGTAGWNSISCQGYNRVHKIITIQDVLSVMPVAVADHSNEDSFALHTIFKKLYPNYVF